MAFSLWHERLAWMMPSLWHPHLASLSVSSLISISLWPGTQVMCMRESLFPSRNSRARLEKRMESCWDGWVCMREMLEIAEELLEKKVMDLIWGLSFTIIHVGSPPETP